MTDDDIIRFIENFEFDAGRVAVERRNRGFTLIHAETGVPIAACALSDATISLRILDWSLWKERWFRGPFGRTAACASTGRAHHRRSGNLLGRHLKQAGKIRKAELRRSGGSYVKGRVMFSTGKPS